jgi:hypothetical protein
VSATPPERFKPLGELTVDELVEHERTGKLPETEAYIEYRNEVLRAAGLEDEVRSPESTESMTVEDHFNEIRRAP